MAELNATINELIVLKTYNQSNIEQFGRCTVKIRHNDKCDKSIFFVVPGHFPELLRMPDIELVSIIRAMCKTIDNKTTSRNYVQFSLKQNIFSQQDELSPFQQTWLPQV